jgi:PBP1b-binding outer membrane lipoprotein LpoB
MKTKNLLAVAILALFVAGCAEDPYSQQAIADQSKSGQMGHRLTGWQAVDIATAPDGTETQIWAGAIELKKETAMQDAADRHKDYPDHNVQVIRPAFQ